MSFRELFYNIFMKNNKESKIKDAAQRPQKLLASIRTIESLLASVESEGEIVADNCCRAEYWARGRGGLYRYFKLQASSAIFPCRRSSRLTKYRHLGRAGSDDHIAALLALAQRDRTKIYCQVLVELRSAFDQVSVELAALGAAEPGPTDVVLGGDVGL